MDKSREQFDLYMKTRFPNVDGFTRFVSTMVWQASRESLEIELPRKHDEDDEYDYFAMGYNAAIEEMEGFIINNGVKIK